MSDYSRIEVALKMKETGMIPVFYNADAETAKQVVKACYDGGVRVFEFTNRGDFAHEVFVEVKKYCLENLPGMMLGVGSIIDAPTAALYIQSGADFIVCPALVEEVAFLANKRKILWSPGCGSVTEITRAHELGAEIVKIFPGKQVGGPDFVKAVRGPLPYASIMPTGGVSPTEENLKEWFTAGVYCVGMGSKLIEKGLLQNKDFATLTKNVKQALDIIKKYKL